MAKQPAPAPTRGIMNVETQTETEPFFNKQFWRMTLIASFSQIIVLCIALAASAVIGGKIDSLTTLFATMNGTLERVETTINTVVGLDTAELAQQAEGIAESAGIVGDGVGEGGAKVVDQVGSAVNNWLKTRNTEDE